MAPCPGCPRHERGKSASEPMRVRPTHVIDCAWEGLSQPSKYRHARPRAFESVIWLHARSALAMGGANLPGGTAPTHIPFQRCLKSPCFRISIFADCAWKHRAQTHPLPMVSEATLLSAYQSSPIVSGSTASARILFQWCLKSPCSSHINLLQLCLEAPRQRASSSNGV